MGGTTKSHDEARRSFLKEGTASYLEAVTALIAYQREVRRKCREVLESFIDQYSDAIGVPLSPSEIKDVAWPAFNEWEDFWGLGVRIVRKNIPGVRHWECYCCFSYEAPDQEPFCWVGEWFPKSQSIDLANRFQRLKSKLKVKQSDKEVWVEKRVAFEQAADFECDLETIFPEWISLWKRAGGFRGVFGTGRK